MIILLKIVIQITIPILCSCNDIGLVSSGPATGGVRGVRTNPPCTALSSSASSDTLISVRDSTCANSVHAELASRWRIGPPSSRGAFFPHPLLQRLLCGIQGSTALQPLEEDACPPLNGSQRQLYNNHYSSIISAPEWIHATNVDLAISSVINCDSVVPHLLYLPRATQVC